jgi:hypothetical protein
VLFKTTFIAWKTGLTTTQSDTILKQRIFKFPRPKSGNRSRKPFTREKKSARAEKATERERAEK